MVVSFLFMVDPGPPQIYASKVTEGGSIGQLHLSHMLCSTEKGRVRGPEFNYMGSDMITCAFVKVPQ